MTTADEVRVLAQRVMGLTVADREVDAEIAVKSGLYVHEKRARDRYAWFYPTTHGKYRKGLWSAGFERLDDYTASLDAAMTLVPEGCAATVCRFSNGAGKAIIWKGSWADTHRATDGVLAATPALALTAAALLARAEAQP